MSIFFPIRVIYALFFYQGFITHFCGNCQKRTTLAGRDTKTGTHFKCMRCGTYY